MNDSTKIRKISFNRNPKFTRGLADARLGALEDLAYQVVEALCKCHPELGFEKFPDTLELWGVLNPGFCKFYGVDFDRDAMTSDDEWAYLKASVNFLLVCAQRKGWMVFGQYQKSYCTHQYDLYR